MADLTSKLADSITKSMSGFGAGIKGAFMSANPAGFGLAMKGIQSVMATQVSLQKKEFAQRQQDRQFAEENANEQRKIDSDKLGTLRSMDDTLKKILAALTKTPGTGDDSKLKQAGRGILNNVPDKNTLGQIALGALAASIYKAAKQWADFFKSLADSIRGLINGLKNIFSGEGALANLIKRIKDLFAEEGALGKLFKRLKDLFAEEGALGKLFKKFKDLFSEESGLGKLFKRFKDLFAEEGGLGKLFKNFKDLFSEEGALGKGIQKLKALFAEEGALGKIFKNFKSLFAEEGALGSFAKKFKSLFADEALLERIIGPLRRGLGAAVITFAAIADSFKDMFSETGFFAKTIQKFKSAFSVEIYYLDKLLTDVKTFFSAEGYLGKLFTKIGTLAGDVGQLLKGVGPLAEEFPKLATFFKGAFGVFQRVLKVIPGLNLIFFAVDGLFSAFDTEQIRKDLGVQEVTLKERVAAFLGGGTGGFLGGIIDASLWLVDKIFGTTFQEKSRAEGGEGTYSEKFKTFFTKVFNETFTFFSANVTYLFDLVKGIFTGNFADFKKSSEELLLIYEDWAVIVLNAFGELGVGIYNMFGRFSNWVGNKLKSSETIGIIYDSVSSAITSIQNGVGRLFHYLGGVVEDAIYSSKKYIADMSEKYLGIKINVDKPAERAAYVPYKAQKFSENYKQTEYVPITYNPIKNVAGEKRAAIQAEKNATYKENEAETQRLANKAKAATATTNKPNAASTSTSGSSSMPGSLTPYTLHSETGEGLGDVPAIRNNNPGNLRYYADNSRTPGGVTYEAQPGPEGSFAIFPTKEAGLRAMRKQIIIDTQNKGKTLAEFITKYAPPSDNNPTGAYISNMAAALGINPNDRVPADKIDQLQAAMILQEGGPKSSAYFGTPSSAIKNTRATPSVSGVGNSSIAGNAFGSPSNINSPDVPPTGTENKPIYTVSTEENPVEQVWQDKLDESIIQTPVLSQAQLDEMKRQQQYREKVDDENKKYRDERDNLEKQFRATLENNIRGQLTSAIPMGATGQAATTNAGANIANKFLAAPMEKLATRLFGKETGKGVGTIFTQLAGSYGNQLINSVLAPSLGMSSEQLNRSFNNFASGNKGAGWADLLYGMTGIPTDLRTAFGYEDGINNFSKSLAKITSEPFSPLFNMGGNVSGVSPAEMSATNAGIIELSAAKQKAQIEIAAATAFGQSVVGSASDFGKALTSGATGGGGTSGGLGTLFGALIGSPSDSGGGTRVYGPPTADGKWSIMSESVTNNGGGFLSNLGNMLSGGKSKDFAATGANFISNLGGSFIGNALGLKTNTFGGSVMQTGINGMIRGYLTGGGAGAMAGFNNALPTMLLGKAIGNLGGYLGSSTLGSFGAGLQGIQGMGSFESASSIFKDPSAFVGEGGSTMAAQLGAAANVIGTAYQGVMISRALSGGYKLNKGMDTVSDIATAVGSVFGGPFGAFIAGTVSAAVNRLFGMKAPELRGMGIQGTLAASTEAGGQGTKVEGWKNMFSKGGTYRSDRNDFSTSSLPPEVAEALMEDIDKNLKDMNKATRDVLGLQSLSRFEDYSQFIKLDFQNKSAEEQEKLLADTMKAFNNAMIESVFPVFKSFAEAGEDTTAAMKRLANSTNTFDASWKMLGYDAFMGPSVATRRAGYFGSSAYGTTRYDTDPIDSLYSEMVSGGVNVAAGQKLTDAFGGLNIDALRAAKLASTPDFANSYYTMKEVIEEETGSKTLVRDGGINAMLALNSDKLLAAEFKNTVLKSFGDGDLEKGTTTFAESAASFFSTYYSPQEQREISLQAAKDKIEQIQLETGGDSLSGVDATTKYQDKIDNYRTQVDAAKDALAADPTNKDKLATYTKLLSNSGAYAQSVKAVIGLSKAVANPADAATENANLAASLTALSSLKTLGGGAASAEQLASGITLGPALLGGYNVYDNKGSIGGSGASVTNIPTYDGTVVPGGGGGSSGGGGTTVITPPPTTYVDNSSSTNLNAGGNDNVRDTYSHPILGSTERSISSTFNYNYLYR